MVRIVDTLSNDLDLGSLQFGASSHRFVPTISGKGQPVLTLVFDPINLPDSARSGQAAASGFVDFRIRSSSTAPLGTQIKNQSQDRLALARNLGYKAVARCSKLQAP